MGGGNDPSSSVNNYYFIDVLENSGLVYGEIIHNILYASLKHVELIIVNGLIYNWKTNAWTNTLNIGNVIFETEKMDGTNLPLVFCSIIDSASPLSLFAYLQINLNG